MTVLESGNAMKKMVLILTVLLSMPAMAEIVGSPDLKRDANAAATVARDILCQGPVTVLATATSAKRLAETISPLAPGRVTLLSGASSVVVEVDTGMLARLRASSEVRSLHRIGPAAEPPSMEALRVSAGRPGGVAVIAMLAVDLPASADDPARRAAIAGVGAELLAAMARFAPTNVKSFDVSPMVALTVDRKGLEALLASSSVCSVSEDTINRPLMGGGVGGAR